jgi:hypothetical protein
VLYSAGNSAIIRQFHGRSSEIDSFVTEQIYLNAIFRQSYTIELTGSVGYIYLIHLKLNTQNQAFIGVFSLSLFKCSVVPLLCNDRKKEHALLGSGR